MKIQYTYQLLLKISENKKNINYDIKFKIITG